MTFARILSPLLFLFVTEKFAAQAILKQTRVDSVAVLFRNASSEIDQEARLISCLRKVAGGPGRKVVLKGYTDTVGSVAFNTALASRRLQSVTGLLGATPLGSLPTDSLNFHETRSGRKVSEPLYRRVDILVYELAPAFSYGEKIDLKIGFENATANMLPESRPSVERLLIALQMDRTLAIELHGHVCCSPNYGLSLRRAQAVRDYLIGKGIPPDRVTCIGFSNDKPLTAERTEADEARNRRVEAVFVDEKKKVE